jgi:endogenous inhibitor of DNA gyrase (YacG/DUF329 family)
VTCPICNGEISVKYRPFCSGRCADIDLAKWLNGSYAAPSTDPDDIDSALEAADAAQIAPDKPH